MPILRPRLHAIVLLLAFAAVLPADAQGPDRARAITIQASGPAAPAPLTLDDYDGWKRITSADISPDGKWIHYAYAPNEGDDTLFVKAIDTNTVHRFVRGSQPSFSPDSRWVVFRVAPAEGRRGRGGAQGQRGQQPPAQPPQGRGGRGGGGASAPLQLMDLTSGETLELPGVANVSFSNDARLLVMTKTRPSGVEHEGADLVLRNLRTGTTRNIGNVSDHAFNESQTLLAYVVDAADKAGNGVYLLELATDKVTPLSTGEHTFSNLTWHNDSRSIAFLRGNTPEDMEQRSSMLHVARGVGGSKLETIEYDALEDADFPEGMVLSHLGGVRWSEDGTRIFVGIKEQREAFEEPDERANVDVWHYMDEDQQSVQERRANQARNFTWSSVFNVGPRKLVRLSDEEMPSVSPASTGKWGIGRDDQPYAFEPDWGGTRSDYYRVDLDTGERTPIVENLMRQMGTSPDGKTFIYWKDDKLIAHDLASGANTDLTPLAPVSFKDVTDDHPYELPTYGLVGWTEDGKSIVMNHRYDIWVVPLDGKTEATNLTAGVGTEQKIRFRIVSEGGGGGGRGGRGGGGGSRTIDLSETLRLSAYGDYTKKSGYFSLKAGQQPQPIIFEDMDIGAPIKADSADRILFTRQTFTEFPDYWLADNDAFRNPRKLTDANPQIVDYAWSPGRVLIDYTDSRGNQLQGTLALPAGYQPGQRYPMLVYFYETMSQQHHSFQMPRYDDRPHISTYASNGYLVLQPDIVYEIGRPGSSAVDDLTAAVEKVIELGYADPERIGLQGHSWGGYQSSYVLTQTDIFAAVVTGAPVTNLVSFYNELYKSSGSVQQGIVEAGQVRMGLGVTPWNAHELYESQSALHNVEKITTPFMILHGTADGSVDWHQGLEYFNAAQRVGKKAILLSYPDEGHHLSQRPNQKDFQIRMRQFFDHYLKGDPAPKWLTDGVPFIEKFRASPMDGLPAIRTSTDSGGPGGR